MSDSGERRPSWSLLDRQFSYRSRPRALVAAAVAVAAPAVFVRPAAAAASASKHVLVVPAGETQEVAATVALTRLVLGEGARLVAPAGYSLTLTVDGVEVGSKLESLYVDAGAYAYIAPGTYCGRVVITVAEANLITYQSHQWPIRQAIYIDADGIDEARSVLTAVAGGRIGASLARDISVTSKSEAFNALYVAGGTYRLVRPTIRMTGNGRNDFIGYGSALAITGATTSVRIENADIATKGVVRDGIFVDAGATLVVRDSTITAKDGTPPAEYVNTGDQAFMMTCPWLLGLYGTVRATNMAGVNTKATYLNTSITNDRWALWSIDSGANGGSNTQLVVVNCEGRHTGTDGYGSYAIGSPTEYFLGVDWDVATYVGILWGSAGNHYGNSSPAAVRALNDSIGLGLTDDDIASVRPRVSTIRSRKFGFMWQAAGPVHIDGGTQITTRRTMFLSKAAASSVFVDGSGGARLEARNGVLYQLMDNDNPGRKAVTGFPWTAEYSNSYVQPTAAAVKSATFDPTVAGAADATGQFTSISLTGDFYNGVLGGGVGNLQGKNLVLTFTDSTVRGVISASRALHEQSPIDFSNYDQLGVVTNTPQAVVNNGVLVTLAGASTWRVTATSYLSGLTVGADARVVRAGGGAPAMTVDGVPTAIVPGTAYTGAITVTP